MIKRLKFRPWYAIVAGIIAVLAIVIFVINHQASSNTPKQLASITMKQAKAMPRDTACRDTTKAVDVDHTTDAQLSQLANNGAFGTHIIDAPAGNYLKVIVTSQNTNTIKGVITYPSAYGGVFNFTMNKLDGSWSYTEFTACK